MGKAALALSALALALSCAAATAPNRPANPLLENPAFGELFVPAFVAREGFKSAVGAQAACVLDKAALLLHFYYCHDGKAWEYMREFEMNCDKDFTATMAHDLQQCCFGSPYVPPWAPVQACRRRLAPALAALRLVSFARCTARGDGWPAKAHFRATGRACGEGVRAARVAARLLFGVANALFSAGQLFGAADKTPQARTFMAACAPALNEHTTVEDAQCRTRLVTLWHMVRTSLKSKKPPTAKPPKPQDGPRSEWAVSGHDSDAMLRAQVQALQSRLLQLQRAG